MAELQLQKKKKEKEKKRKTRKFPVMKFFQSIQSIAIISLSKEY